MDGEPSDLRQGSFEHLGPFSDLIAVAQTLNPLFPQPSTAAEARRLARETSRFTVGSEMPSDIRTERNWQDDGVDGEEISWWVGYGPRTHAWVLKPAGARAPLPGVVALYDHGHYKFFGKEKIADGPEGPLDALTGWRNTYYGGRAFANALAREGFVRSCPRCLSLGEPTLPR